MQTPHTISPRLATRFGGSTRSYRSVSPLDDDKMRAVAPSIFAENKRGSRSDRYAYIPTSEVLRGLAQDERAGRDPRAHQESGSL